jgi:hypothetical protein
MRFYYRREREKGYSISGEEDKIRFHFRRGR